VANLIKLFEYYNMFQMFFAPDGSG